MELNREILKSSSKIRRRKIERFLSLVFLAAVSLANLSFFLLQQGGLQVKQVDISGNKDIGAEALFDNVKRVLSGKYFGFYPKTNFFIYPKDDIKKEALRLSAVDSVEIVRGGSTLYIAVKEREPKYLWCGDLETPQEDRRCFYVDAGGFSYSRAPEFSDHIFFEFYGGEKLGGYTGKNILPTNQFNDVASLADYLEKSVKQYISPSAEVYGADIKKNGDVDFLVEDGDDSWNIQSTVALGYQEPSKKMGVAVSSPAFQEELKKSGSGLLYLDLRFGRKVFYKFQ